MKNFRLLGSLIAALVLSSCSSNDNGGFVSDDAAVAIIATVAADFSSGAHAVVSEDFAGNRSTFNDLLPTGSDITIAAFGENFYRIERAFAGNNITKFAASAPQTPIWQYSTEDGGPVSSDPHDMIFVSETKAYILRYGSNIAWIVNPSAATEAEFKTGELDLAAYDADGIPEMDSGLIVGDRLYITLQRLDNFAVTQDAYIAVFDVNTDQEVDTGTSGGALKGVPLQIRNPTNIVYEPISKTIYVQGSGSFFPVEYTGGIEKIDVLSLNATLVLDDGTDMDHPYGLITELAVVSEDVLYFVGYAGFTDNTLYKMDLNTMVVTPTSVASFISSQIAYLTVDGSGQLWVSDSANATVRIIDPVTETEVDALSTNLNPDKIVFVD
jgi:hypothetical protein